MRLVHLTRVEPGMVVARPVYGAEGQKLLSEGTELRNRYVDYLQKLGVSQVYVEDEQLEGVVSEDVVDESTWLEIRSAVKEMMVQSKGDDKSEAPAQRQYLIEDVISKRVDELIESMIGNPNLIVNLADIRSANSYLFDHSIKVTTLSTAVGIKLNYPVEIIRQNAYGFLLHDLGYISVPEEILKKEGPLTKEEFEKVKEHAMFGYEIFKRTSFFSESAGSIILQHHERLNGQGYPYGLEEDSIHWLAQLAGIADTYDALTSHRPFRKPFRPDEALNILYKEANEGKYNMEMLSTFSTIIAAYPLGTHVLLNSGHSGLVIGNTGGYPYQPKVRVLYKGRKRPLSQPYEVDLVEQNDLKVEEVVD